MLCFNDAFPCLKPVLKPFWGYTNTANTTLTLSGLKMSLQNVPFIQNAQLKPALYQNLGRIHTKFRFMHTWLLPVALKRSQFVTCRIFLHPFNKVVYHFKSNWLQLEWSWIDILFYRDGYWCHRYRVSFNIEWNEWRHFIELTLIEVWCTHTYTQRPNKDRLVSFVSSGVSVSHLPMPHCFASSNHHSVLIYFQMNRILYMNLSHVHCITYCMLQMLFELKNASFLYNATYRCHYIKPHRGHVGCYFYMKNFTKNIVQIPIEWKRAHK